MDDVEDEGAVEYKTVAKVPVAGAVAPWQELQCLVATTVEVSFEPMQVLVVSVRVLAVELSVHGPILDVTVGYEFVVLRKTELDRIAELVVGVDKLNELVG